MTYECHITITGPANSHELNNLEEFGREHKWKTSVINGDPQLGNYTFFYFTRHAKTLEEMRRQMDEMALLIGPENVLRKKIEHIVYDTKTGVGI